MRIPRIPRVQSVATGLQLKCTESIPSGFIRKFCNDVAVLGASRCAAGTSTPGKGTSFVRYFPAVQEAARKQEPAAPNRPASRTLQARTRRTPPQWAPRRALCLTMRIALG